MKLKTILIFIILIFCSCSGEMTRTVTVVIPKHPWEEYSGQTLWYLLKWGSSLDNIQTMYVYDEREITIKVPLGCTVYFCAYPVGQMQCFGDGICPQDSRSVLFLNQNRGVICDLFLNTDGKAAANVDLKTLFSDAEKVCSNNRGLEKSQLLTDMLNGKLSGKSAVVSEPVCVQSFSVLSGVWISEIDYLGRITVTDGMFGELYLYPGVYRFWNIERELELRVAVDDEGNVFHHLKQFLISEGNMERVVYEN